jgi:predicted Zn-dependent protease
MINLTQSLRGRPLRAFLAGALAFSLIFTPLVPVQAQGMRSAPIIIRDTEIENWLRDWATPVIRAAGLEPKAVNFILVQDNNLNAFVAGGQNIFIYTGLLLRSENAAEVVGVIAHETGHIRGGHLIRIGDAMEKAGYESMLGALLGIGTAIVTGNGQAAAAVAAGVSGMATSRLLSFSRVQESSADQAGLTYLQAAGLSPHGLVSFMDKLADQELLPPTQQTAYIRTHPLTRDRIEALTAGMNRSPHAHKPDPAEWADQHARMKAKLVSFITPERVAWDYGSNDQSAAARYARTIADYRQNHVDSALAGIDGLLAEEPDNAYYHELKGQMLVDFSRVKEALPSYKKAVALDSDAALIRIAYAHALIESTGKGNDKASLTEAIKQLERARNDEPRSTRVNRLLATAYGRVGDDAAAKVYLAEEALLKRETEYAKRLATTAVETLPAGSKHRLRAQDIISYIEQSDEKE